MSTLFRILFDTTDSSVAQFDCDCACPHALPLPNAAALPTDARLCSHPQQWHMPLSAHESVHMVPSLSRVAVLNHEARQLLQRFDHPLPLASLDMHEQDAAHQLFAAGLLSRAGVAPEPPPPPDELVAWLHVTNACNLRCTYCYIHKTDEGMAADTAFAAIDAVLRAAQQHGYARVRLKYAGGEASLNLSLVEEMHRYALERARASDIAVQGVLLSNGVGLTRHKLRRIDALGLRLMISLDGMEAVHDAQRPNAGGRGSFAAVVASIERAREMRLDLTVSVTVTGASVAGLPETVAWLLERDIHFSLNFYRECHSGTSLATLRLDEQRIIEGVQAAYAIIAQHPPRYSLLGCLLDRANLGAAHRRTCAVGENYLVIDQRGDIAKCQMQIAQPVTNVWEHDPLNVIRLDQAGVQNLPVEEKAGCRDCEWKYWCAGGCPVATFRATGRYDVQSPNCAIYKALYPHVIRLEGLRLLHWAPDATS